LSPHQNDWDAEEREALEDLRRDLEEIRRRHGADPPLELLRAAKAGVLPDEVQKAVEDYLDKSAWSQALVEGVESVDVTLDADSEKRLLERIRLEAKARPQARWTWGGSWRILVAAVGLAACVFLVLHFPASKHVSPPPVAPVAAVPAAPTTAEFLLALEKPDVKLAPSSLTVRGEQTQSRFLEDLAPALTAYRQNDYQSAEKQLVVLRSRYPKSVEVQFYLGVSRLFLGNAAGAIEPLNAARKIASETFGPDALWYLAVAYERAGNTQAASAELAALCSGTSAFKARACDGVRVLKPVPSPDKPSGNR